MIWAKAYAWSKLDTRYQFGLMGRIGFSPEQRDRRFVPVRTCCQHQILQRAAQADMLFTETGIKCTRVSLYVSVDFDNN